MNDDDTVVVSCERESEHANITKITAGWNPIRGELTPFSRMSLTFGSALRETHRQTGFTTRTQTPRHG